MNQKIILSSFFVGILSVLSAFAECSGVVGKFAGTDFKSSNGADRYDLSKTVFTDPSSESMVTGYAYNGSSNLLSGQYTVTKNPQLVLPGKTDCNTPMMLLYNMGDKGTSQSTLFTYTLSGLVVGEKYTVKFKVYNVLKSPCQSSQQGGNLLRLNFHASSPKYENWDFEGGLDFGKSKEYTYEFTAVTSKNTITLGDQYSRGCVIFGIADLSVTGCTEQKIVSSNGTKPCAGEETTLVAKGLGADTYKWEVSVDNGTTWSVLSQTTASITLEISNESIFRVTAGGTTLTSDKIRPVVCCAVSGHRVSQVVENFSLSQGSCRDFIKDYTCVPNRQNNVNEGQYCIAKSLADGDGGWWKDRDLVGHTQEIDPTTKDDDGFLLVNADAPAGRFYTKVEMGLCQNMVYDFSAYIANACPKDGKSDRVLPNVRFVVLGCDDSGNNCQEVLLEVESGDLPDGTDWTEKGGSFNSGKYKAVQVAIYNNVDASVVPGGKVVGNDVTIDDITFSTCSPELKTYTNATFTTQDTTVCNQGEAVPMKLYAQGVYSMKEFFTTPNYVYQFSDDKKTWTNIQPSATTSPSCDIVIPATQTSPKYYRSVVAGDATTAENVAKGILPTPGSCTIYGISDTISIVYFCECEPTPVPEVTQGYAVCVSQSAADCQHLSTLVTKRSTGGTLQFYDEDGNKIEDIAMPCTKVGIYTYAVTDKKPDTPTMEYCESDKVTFTVEVMDNLVLTLVPNPDVPVCQGTELSLSVSYTLKQGESILWKVDGTEIPGQTDVVLPAQKPDKTVTYTADLQGGQCEGHGELEVEVDEPAAPQISVDKDVICVGTSITITDSDESEADSYTWYENEQLLAGQTEKDLVDYVPQASATYKKVSNRGVCSTESNEVTVKVHPAIQFTVEPVGKKICEGDAVNLRISNYPTSAEVEWIDKATGEVLATAPVVTVTPTVTTTYTAKVVDVCTAEKDLTIEVLPSMNPVICADQTICQGESANLSVTGEGIVSYAWTPTTGLDNPTIANPVATPSVTTTYAVTISNGICADQLSTTVTVGPLPHIISVTASATEQCSDRSVTVEAGKGTPPYQYSDDGKNYTVTNVFSDLPSGNNKFYVKDANQCQGDTIVYLEPFPITPDRYFSPNDMGDPRHERWQVVNLNCYGSYVVEIFNRDGTRLLTWRKGQFSSEGNTEDFPGWDGTYRGNAMPSTDYWYLITVEEIRKQYNGHFILKR